jgi:hypothetical protein
MTIERINVKDDLFIFRSSKINIIAIEPNPSTRIKYQDFTTYIVKLNIKTLNSKLIMLASNNKILNKMFNLHENNVCTQVTHGACLSPAKTSNIMVIFCIKRCFSPIITKRKFQHLSPDCEKACLTCIPATTSLIRNILVLHGQLYILNKQLNKIGSRNNL